MTQKVLIEQNSRTALTVRENVEGRKLPQYTAAIIATLSSFSMGACLAWTSAALPLLESGMTRVRTTAEQGSWIGALITLGAFAGAIPTGSVISKIGPKRTLQLMAFPLFTSWVTIAYCGSVYGLYAARFLAGMAIGAICVACPTYVSEIAETKIRGTLGTLFQLQITMGLLIGYVMGAFIEDFIILALISAIVPVLFLMLLAFMPESPRYLASNCNYRQARLNLQWLRGKEYDVDDEMTKLNDSVKHAGEGKGWKQMDQLFKHKHTLRALMISLGLMVFQQLSGINAVLFYAENIFKDAGSSLPAKMCPILIGAVQVVATYISTLMIDRKGRRLLLLVSSCAMSICLFTLAIYMHYKSTGISIGGYIPLASLGVYIVAFSFGFGPIPWLMMGELFATDVKELASSISAAFNWLLAFAVTKLFHNMVILFGSAITFSLFGIICVFGNLFVMFVVPETKGKDIEEILAMLRSDVSPRRTLEEENEIGVDVKENQFDCC